MWKVIITTFCMVFIAELGDKTQIETILLTAKSGSPIPVFIGSSLALICSSLIAVYAGSFITKVIPTHYIRNAAGALFVLMGILILFDII